MRRVLLTLGGRSLASIARDRAAGVLYSAHVPRRRPLADASSFTSLRRAPHRPDLPPSLVFEGFARHRGCRPRTAGGRRSEVKEEGRAQPDPGDMSAAGHPAALARAMPASGRQQWADSRQCKPSAT